MHWFTWARREASRLLWSFLAHYHTTKAKRPGLDLEVRRHHLRRLLDCHNAMKGRKHTRSANEPQ